MFSGHVLSLLAPGQGSQTPGMFTEWLSVPGTTDRVTAWSDAIGLDLVRLGTSATAEEITDTAITQPLVVASALLSYGLLREKYGDLPADTVVAGHSVGELAAAAIAGVITDDEAVRLAAIRGAEMAEACALVPTTMAAVLGGDEAQVLAKLEQYELIPANRNATGQIVAPMQGTIVKVDVAVGDTVTAGQVVCVLEAMKMENNVASDVAGTVAEVKVEGGQAVASGDVVVIITPAAS